MTIIEHSGASTDWVPGRCQLSRWWNGQLPWGPPSATAGFSRRPAVLVMKQRFLGCALRAGRFLKLCVSTARRHGSLQCFLLSTFRSRSNLMSPTYVMPAKSLDVTYLILLPLPHQTQSAPARPLSSLTMMSIPCLSAFAHALLPLGLPSLHSRRTLQRLVILQDTEQINLIHQINPNDSRDCSLF